MQFYFDRRISFVKHAIQRITIIPRLMYFSGRAHVRTATLARQRPPPTEFHFCKLFFHFVPRARSSVLSPRVSGIEPWQHNKSFLSSSRVASAFLCLRLTTRLSFSITIKSRRARTFWLNGIEKDNGTRFVKHRNFVAATYQHQRLVVFLLQKLYGETIMHRR